MRAGTSRLGATLCVLALLACLAPSALAAEPTKKALSFDVVVGPGDDQPCTITADLYTPPGASSDHPVPAVMGTNGFGGSKSDFEDLGPAYAKRGYAFLAYSGLGFGNSGCKITLDDPDYDGKAGSQLLSFLGGTKAAKDGTRIGYIAKDGPGDPRVGMIGGSYGGQVQFAVAGLDRRLDTIVPQITWNDLSYSLGPNNTDFERGVTYRTPGVLKLDWPVLFTALGLGVGFQQAVQNQDPSHLGACPNFADQVCFSLVESSARGYPTPGTLALLRHASVSAYMARIRIPTFLVQGQSDTLFNLQEAVSTYKALRAQGTRVKMLWRSSGHSGGSIPGESNDEAPESAYESRLALQWFDHYLRGVGIEPAADFSFLRDWVSYEGDAAPAVGVAPAYPPGPDQTLYLSGTNRLVSEQGSVEPGAAGFGAVPEGTGSGEGAVEVPGVDTPGTFASYDSAPLADDVDLVGVPSLRVKVDAPTFEQSQSADPSTRLVLFARLLDVAPDGSTTLPRNQLSAVRVADVTKPVEIDLPGVAHRFAKGHVMRLVVSTSNSTSRGNTLAGPVSIGTDPADPATLTFPKLGARVSAVPGRCLSRRSSIGPRNIGRVRLRYTRRTALRRIRPQPVGRSPRSYRWCVRRSPGRVRAVFSRRGRRGRIRLVVSTARAHGNRKVRPRTSARRLRRAYPRRRAIGPRLYRASPRSRRLIGVRRGRIRFVGVADRRLLGRPKVLRRYLRLAGVRGR